MTRASSYIAIALLTAGACVCGLPRLMGGASRTLSSEEAVTRAADVLGVSPAQMRATGEPIHLAGGQFERGFVVDGKRITVEVGRLPDSFTIRWEDEDDWPQRMSGGAQRRTVDIATARRMAEALVCRRFPDMRAMRLIRSELLGTGSYMFAWAQATSEGALLGNEARVFVNSANSHLRSYTERRVSASVQVSPPRISREDADRIARSVLAARVGEARKMRLDAGQSGLVLNSPLSPTGGPVWELSYVDETPAPTAFPRL